MDIEKKTNKINRLCSEVSLKILQKKGELSVLLINFARDYNKIWSEE